MVLGTENKGDRAREEVLSVVPDLSLRPELVEVCRRLCENSVVPLPVVLRAALPPGVETGRYRVIEPSPGWPWEIDATVTRVVLERALGPDGLRAAEAEGRIVLAPAAPQPATVEWAVIRAAAEPDLARAPRQRDLFVTLKEHGGEIMTSTLLSETGASRGSLRELVRRGAARLVRRQESPPLQATLGHHAVQEGAAHFSRTARRAVKSGGPFLWRTKGREEDAAVVAIVTATLEAGRQALVLAPEVGLVERLVDLLRRALEEGHTVAPYHSGLGRGRIAVHEAGRKGNVDVVVGTRTAALLGLARPGSICVVDEPNGAHRAEPGHEGLPVHVRDVALERARLQRAAVFFLSPCPSLRIYAPEVRRRERIRELPAGRAWPWPAVRIVDMRGSGAAFSSTLERACRRCMEGGGKTGVVLKRLGYATAVACSRCGTMKICPNCDLPLVSHGRDGPLACTRCGYREEPGPCAKCGSTRLRHTGLGVERARAELSDLLGTRVGLITAEERDHTDAPVVVGTVPRILDGEWDAVILPDADAFLAGSGTDVGERSFRLFYGAAAVARKLLLVQTHVPEHYALRAGVSGDYEAFAAAELPRLRELGYPPFAHAASLTFEGSEAALLGAVESHLRPALDAGVEMSGPFVLGRTGETTAWRVLLRAKRRPAVARAATVAAKISARTRGLEVRIDVDPEEV
ncbi:MAG: Helicase PriA essential for oriC/DnaA-independent DNA replication [uncultured Rubrobacteraceae bacterium]|uniref:Helicase PriA essential for oriC/DnaA-independent DNA replication n=1 Tax=uncultured Rubrobacteraceae bacterium TaxID=349277 RepID=A0A6J4QIN3_9ACTN|nr:MAG: Helicase PriA essential for oriC/DnaA-independent DNA replication [uncultured Rubrobacteraceae bacterium]